MYEVNMYYTNNVLGKNNIKKITYSEFATNLQELKKIILIEKEKLEDKFDYENLKVLHCSVFKFEKEILF